MMFMPVNGQGGDFNGFLAMFIVLFALTGVGNGSTFRMIPVIFLRERTQAAEAGARPGASRRWPRPPRNRRRCWAFRRDRRLWRLSSSRAASAPRWS